MGRVTARSRALPKASPSDSSHAIVPSASQSGSTRLHLLDFTFPIRPREHWIPHGQPQQGIFSEVLPLPKVAIFVRSKNLRENVKIFGGEGGEKSYKPASVFWTATAQEAS